MPSERMYHDDKTLRKAYEAMSLAGLNDQQIVDSITELQNANVFFREPDKWRPPVGAPVQEELDMELSASGVVSNNVFINHKKIEELGRVVDRRL